MSSLKTTERMQLERLFGMGSGYVLDFSNRTFQQFIIENASVDIYDEKYAKHGESKAKRFRAFWELEPDHVVGKVLVELTEYWAYSNPNPSPADAALLADCRRIAGRLLGKDIKPADPERRFLEKNLDAVSLREGMADASLLPILRSRISEAQNCVANEAPLAAIFLCGSILEGLLLGNACSNPKLFNQASNSPKDRAGKVRQFQEWKLAELIDVAYEVGHLSLDVKKFSHVLRDFRNYIHPYQQMASGFAPDKHTAELCLQVLKAAIACLNGERG